MMICPHCGLDSEISSVQQIVDILRRDRRRDIYEMGDSHGKGTGKFTVSYAHGLRRKPVFSLAVAQEVERTGIVYSDPDCPTWFRRSGN